MRPSITGCRVSLNRCRLPNQHLTPSLTSRRLRVLRVPQCRSLLRPRQVLHLRLNRKLHPKSRQVVSRKSQHRNRHPRKGLSRRNSRHPVLKTLSRRPTHSSRNQALNLKLRLRRSLPLVSNLSHNRKNRRQSPSKLSRKSQHRNRLLSRSGNLRHHPILWVNRSDLLPLRRSLKTILRLSAGPPGHLARDLAGAVLLLTRRRASSLSFSELTLPTSRFGVG
jgi:hypothetical protein